MIPKLTINSLGDDNCVVYGKDVALSKVQATKIIRQVEEHQQIIDLLRYFYNLPSNSAENFEEHLAKLELAKPYIEGKPCKKCKWKYDDIHDFWGTNCGKSFTLIEGEPKDNGMNFCPYCGKELWQLKYE